MHNSHIWLHKGSALKLVQTQVAFLKKKKEIEDKETREKAEDVGRKMRRGKQREMSQQAEDGVEEHVMWCS